MLGPAPVVDFDGTVARLEIPWDGLRAALGVARIDDLWREDDPIRWEPVTAAELNAAARARLVPETMDCLLEAESVAILTSNGEAAVRRFLRRYPTLESRVAVVVGRETLRGPKSDLARFTRGFDLCVASNVASRGDGPVVYAGDSAYELDFAKKLGATTFHVDELGSALRNTTT